MCSPLNIIWLSSIFIKVYKHLEWWHDLGSFGVHKMSTTDKLWKFHSVILRGLGPKPLEESSVKNNQLSLKFQEHISLVNGRFLSNQNGIYIYIYTVYIYYKQPIIVFTDWKRNLPGIGTWSGNPEMFSGKSGYFTGFLHIWGSIILSNFQVSCGMDLLMPHPFSNFNAFHVGPIPVVSLSGKRWCYVGGLIVSENANEITNLRRSTAAAGSFSEVLSMVFHRKKKTCIIEVENKC